MFENLKGKTAIVTGGSNGIGKAIVKLLLKQGLNVAFTYNQNRVELASLNEEMGCNNQLKQYKLDLESKEDIVEVVNKVEEDFGQVDFLINNAGITRDNYMMFISDENWNKVIATNLTGTNLDLLPFPDYHEWKMSEIHLSKMFSFVTSRGCPSNCIFCSSKALSGSKYRFYSSEWVYSMIVHFYKIYKFSHMAFLDDTLLANGLRARRICKYLKFFSVEKGFGWACKSRADMINEDIVRELRESGCAAIHVGVENINQAVLDKMGKGVKIDDIYNAIMLTNKYEMRLDCSFIIGLPGETLKTIEDTLLFSDVVDKEGYGTPAIGIATPFPGTALLNNAEKYGITIKEKNYQKYDLGTPIFELEGVKLNDLRKAHFYFHHQRFTSINPGLTGRTDDEIKEVREEFLKRLKGGLDVES